MRRTSRHSAASRAAVCTLFVLGTAVAVEGCTSLTAVDWSLVDDPASGGSAGSNGTGGTSDVSDGGEGPISMAGNDGTGGNGDGGEPPTNAGSGGMGGTMAGMGGTMAGMGGTMAGTGGTTAGTGGTTAGTGGTTAGTGGTAGSGGSAGSGGTSPGFICGDNTVQAGECEPPGTALCSNDCVQVASQECFDCEQAICFEFSSLCTSFSDGERVLCYDVHECILRTDCAKGDSTLTSCFCGALETEECQAAPNSGAGAPAGPCAAIIREGMSGPPSIPPTPPATNNQVLLRMNGGLSFPAGVAIQRISCGKINGCGPVCGF